MEKDIEKVLKILIKNGGWVEGRKEKKVKKLILRNATNEEFFDILLEKTKNEGYMLSIFRGDLLKQISIENQKKLIDNDSFLLEFASEDIKNDPDYILKILEENPLRALSIQHIGDALRSDLNFMNKLKEKEPMAFAQALYNHYISLPKDETKEFFINNPQEIQFIPKEYAEDDLFVQDVIVFLDPNYADFYNFFNINPKVLTKQEIKQTLLEGHGEALYYKYLMQSITNNDINYIKTLAPEEVKRMLFTNPQLAEQLNSELVNNNQELISILRAIKKLNDKNIEGTIVDKPNKLYKELFEMSQMLGKNISYNQIVTAVNQNYQELQEYIVVLDDVYIFPALYNVLIGIETGKLKDALEIFKSNIIDFNVQKVIENIKVTPENSEFLKMMLGRDAINNGFDRIETYQKLYLQLRKIFPDPDLLAYIIQKIDANEKISDLLKNEDISALDEELLINLVNFVQSDFKRYFKFENLEQLRNYHNFINSNLDFVPKTENINMRKKLLLTKFAEVDLQTANRFVIAYFSANKDNNLYVKFPEALAFKNLFEKIDSARSIEELSKIEEELTNMGYKSTFKQLIDISRNIKDYFEEDIRKAITSFEEPGIYDMSDKDFKMLVHVFGAYGTVPEGNIYDAWNIEEMRSPAICTSFISEGNMGIARLSKESVVFGFDKDLPTDYLEIMSSYDLASSGFQAGRESRFMGSSELIDSTRFGHNELVIRRKKDIYSGSNIQPSYIVCFDQVTKEAKEAAERFGIPIVYIDRQKQAARQHDKIVNMMNEFKSNPTPELVSRIIIEQENNRAGLKLGRPDLMEKYFSQQFRQANVNELYEIIKSNINDNNLDLIECMQKFVEALEGELDKRKELEVGERKNGFDLDCNTMLEEFKNNPNFKKDVLEEKKEKLVQLGYEKLALMIDEMKSVKDQVEVKDNANQR